MFRNAGFRIPTVIIVLLLALNSAAQSDASGAEPERRYGGRTLEEWRLLVKSGPLVGLEDPEIVAGLMEIVADNKAAWADRRQAALTLGRLGPAAKQAVPLFTQLLESPGNDAEATRLWALKALSLLQKTGAAASASVARLVRDNQQPYLIRATAMETLAGVGANWGETLPTLIGMLADRPDRHDNDELRQAAATALGLLGPAASPALPALIDALRGDWALLRAHAAAAIGSIGARGEIAVPALVDVVLFDSAFEPREAAAIALGQIGTPALPALSQLLEDSDPKARQLAIRGLENLSAPESLPVLKTAMQDADPANRVLAASALWQRANDADAGDLLLDALSWTPRSVRFDAYQALRENPAALADRRAELERIRSTGSTTAAKQAARQLLQLLDEE